MSRKKSAGICLAAMFLAMAPGALVRLAAADPADCCASGMCPAGHHQHQRRPAPKPDCHSPGEKPLDDTSMQPCRHEEQAAVNAQIFLPAVGPSVNLEWPMEWAIAAATALAPAYSPEIPSPPPRPAFR